MIQIQNLTRDSFVIQGKGNIVSEMGKEKVMLSVQKGKYYNLGQIGGEIWDLIKYPISVSQVITSLLSSYHVDEVLCEGQTLAFLEHMYQEGLVEEIK